MRHRGILDASPPQGIFLPPKPIEVPDHSCKLLWEVAKTPSHQIDKRPESMKPNISALARLHGISRQTLATWQREGIDISNPQAIAERKLTMRGKPSATLEPPPAPGAETIAEARRRRAVADADFAELRAQREAGTLVDLATVEASFAALGHQMRAHLLALPVAAAAELEGLDAAGIAAALRKHVIEILAQLYAQSHEATCPTQATD